MNSEIAPTCQDTASDKSYVNASARKPTRRFSKTRASLHIAVTADQKLQLISMMLISIICAPVAVASISRGGEAQPLRSLAEWLIEGGKQSVVRSHILAAMDLPAQDMPVRERGFRHQGEQLTHVCSISSLPAYADLMFFAQVDESNGDATIWRTGVDGVLVSTVRFSAGVAQRVPNEEFKGGFDFEKMIFTTRMRIDKG